MKGGRLKRLLTDDNFSLLRGYEQHEIDMHDLQIMTNFKNTEIRYVLNRYFPDSLERRIENKLHMEAKIEHYINMAFPVDVFNQDIMLIKHLYQNQSLLRFIQRLIDNHDIEVELPQVTLYKFKSIVKRLQIKRAIVENMQQPKPLALKHIAKSHHISVSSIFKINRVLNNFDPYNTSLDGKLGEKIEYLYDIHLDLSEGASMTSIQAQYGISIDDVRMIKKVFRQIN
ncbi:hypothetical protein [Staphylococcus equorum]|uniref:hypothetical protein n=1 Tax=Staphylococcus equorum TaxID=246432 RepID=UPI003FD7A237